MREEPRAQLGRRGEIAPDEKELHLLPFDAEALRRVAHRPAQLPGLPVDLLHLRRRVPAQRPQGGGALGDEQQLGQRVPDGLAELMQRVQRLVHPVEGLGMRGSGEAPRARLLAVGQGLRPDLPPEGVVREAVELRRQPLGVESLDGLHDAPVQGAPALVQESRIGHLVRQRVPERVLQSGSDPTS